MQKHAAYFDYPFQYPFYSGADYAFFTAKFEYIVRTGDEKAYKIISALIVRLNWGICW